MKYFGPRAGALAVAALAWSAVAQSATVTFTDTSLGGSNYLFAYSVTSAPADPTFQELTIYTDLSLTNLINPNAPAGWSPIVVQPSPALGPGPSAGDGFYDVAATGPGLAPGSTLTGLSFEATYTGTGSPTAPQFFTFVDPKNNYAVVASGNATVSPVPIPAAAWLFGSSLLTLGFGASRRRVRAVNSLRTTEA